MDEGIIKRALCGATLVGSIWAHLADLCLIVLDDYELEDQEVIRKGQKATESNAGLDLWLRGLRPLGMPDSLGLRYQYQSSWDEELLDVSGCLLGSDGSGGGSSADAHLPAMRLRPRHR